MKKECNRCEWIGDSIECVFCGDVGPLCPKCHSTTIDANEMKTTKSPWQWHPIGKIYFVPQNDFHLVCHVGSNTSVACVINEADAMLIAAAPELRDALSAMLTEMGMDENEYNKPTFSKARRALALVESGVTKP